MQNTGIPAAFAFSTFATGPIRVGGVEQDGLVTAGDNIFQNSGSYLAVSFCERIKDGRVVAKLHSARFGGIAKHDEPRDY